MLYRAPTLASNPPLWVAIQPQVQGLSPIRPWKPLLGVVFFGSGSGSVPGFGLIASIDGHVMPDMHSYRAVLQGNLAWRCAMQSFRAILQSSPTEKSCRAVVQRSQAGKS